MHDLLDPDGDREVRAAVAGQTVPGLFAATVAGRGREPALRRSPGEAATTWSWDDYAGRAGRTAALLDELGVAPGDRVAVMLRNRAEFHPIDLGAALAGAVPFSVYNSSSPDQVRYLLEHSEATVVFVEPLFAPTVRAVVAGMRPAPRIVVVDGAADGGETSWEAAIEGVAAGDVAERAARVSPGSLATLIYTSGTTGPPKAVMLSHANICWLLESLTRVMDLDLAGRAMLSYLPMAHVAERVFTHYLPARTGAVVTPCPNPAEVGAYLPQVRPEAFFGPPRVFEKMRAGLLAALSASPEGAALLGRGLAAGGALFAARSEGRDPDAAARAEWDDVDAALFASVRARVGLDACRVAFTGAAPPPVEVIEFFNAIGVPLSEVYGLSEDTGLMTADTKRPRAGTVGRPIPGCSVRVLDDGEVLCRGGHVFQGYFKDPARTAEVLDAEGWLHSGDLAVVEDGYLRIVDRLKELIITAGGKNISPANIETQLKRQPLIAEACVIGDRRPYVTAVLTLDPDAARVWSAEQGRGKVPVADLVDDADLRAAVERSVADVNEHLSNVERVKRFHLSADEWLPDSEILTPTMKLKRRGVLARYAREIDDLYA